MREGWEKKTLEELCEIARGGSPRPIKAFITDDPRGVNWIKISDATASNKYIYETKQKIKTDGIKRSRLVKDGDFLLSNSMSFGRPYIMRTTGCIHDGWLVLSDKSGLFNQDYLYYFLGSPNAYKQFDARAAGSTVRNLNIDLVKSVTIPLPPLAEQRRIVGVLDLAFAAIGVAEANARKNLANARELFETTLNDIFTQKGEGWVEKPLGEACQIKPPKKEAKEKLQENELVSFLPMTDLGVCQFNAKASQNKTLANAVGSYTYFADDDVLLAKITPCFENGKLGIARNLTNGIGFGSSEYVVLRTKADLIPEYLFFFLSRSSFRKEGQHVMTGAVGHKRVPKEFVENYIIPVPPLDVQKAIAKTLNKLSTQTQRLQALYQQKLDDLAELKQSLLQKAFAGELAQEVIEGVDTSAPEFTANVICFAYHQHVKAQRQRTYGRVKAQKNLHLTESLGHIDLGRQPIKDAAGPNDSAHMRGAETWAKQQQFFEFVKRDDGIGYDFKKLPRYEEMKAKALAMLKPYRPQLEKVTGLLIDKDTKAAEILATVHAAWNNLIIDGVEPTDEAILHEARENWHRDKLAIDKSKFRDAIAEIRRREIQPDGTAKYVGKAQEELL